MQLLFSRDSILSQNQKRIGITLKIQLEAVRIVTGLNYLHMPAGSRFHFNQDWNYWQNVVGKEEIDFIL